MSIEEIGVVDFIGTDNVTGNVVLTISDHLPWDLGHFHVLERKIAAYVDFVNSGQLTEQRPDTAGRPVEISIVCKHEIPLNAREVLKAAKKDLDDKGFTLSFRVLREDF